SKEDIPQFIRWLQTISEDEGRYMLEEAGENWEKIENRLLDLANRGLLRSYCLMFGDIPLALMLSWQYRNTLYVARTKFNKEFSHLSPGSCLFHMVVKNLIETDGIEEIQFGTGGRKLSH